jgi:hypothetical protein
VGRSANVRTWYLLVSALARHRLRRGCARATSPLRRSVSAADFRHFHVV